MDHGAPWLFPEGHLLWVDCTVVLVIQPRKGILVLENLVSTTPIECSKSATRHNQVSFHTSSYLLKSTLDAFSSPYEQCCIYATTPSQVQCHT
jgi:hypothetical protein